MGTSEDKLTIKQRKWLKLYIKTGNATEAAFQVYDCKDKGSAANIGWENVRKLQMDELMEEMGLTDIALMNIGTEGMTKSVKQSMTGETFPDYAVRHKYWDTMLKLKQKLIERKDITSGGKVIPLLSTLDVSNNDSSQEAETTQ